MACSVCKGICNHAELIAESQDIAAALALLVEPKSLRFVLVLWDETGTAALASNAHQVTVRHQLAKVLNAELEKDFRELAATNATDERTAH